MVLFLYVTARRAASGYSSLISPQLSSLIGEASPARKAFSRESLLIMYTKKQFDIYRAKMEALLISSRYSNPEANTGITLTSWASP